MKNTRTRFKPIFLIIGVLLVLVAGYTVFAYVVHMWPFKNSTAAQQQSVNKPTDSRQAAKKDLAPTTPQYNLKFTTTIKADEQGDCLLTMKNGKNELTQKGTTKGVAGQVGCPEWQLNTSKLPAGKYEVTVVFTGETSSETSKSSITLP